MKTMELTAQNAWKAYWDEGKSFPECSKLFGVSVGTLKRRFTEWSFPTRPRGPRSGTAGAGPKAVLTDEQIRYILDNVGKISVRALGEELGVSGARIHQIQKGQHRPID